MSNLSHPVAGIIFDKDGTLIDFERSFASASLNVITALAGENKSLIPLMAKALEFDHLALTFTPRSVVIAGSGSDVTKCLADAMGVPSNKALEAQVDTLYARHTLDSLAPFEGVETVVRQLSAQGIKLGIATNDSEESARLQSEKMGIFQFMEYVVGYDSGHGAKPEPGMVLGFCRKFNLDPAQVMMVGDSLHDLHCGNAAGAITVAVTSGPATADELAGHADHVIDGIWDLPALLSKLGE